MILLTGAAGFIGKNLLKELINKNFKDIILVEDLNNKKKINILKSYQYSNLFDYREIIKILNSKDFNIDTIFHLGANSNTTCKNNKLMNEQNFNFTKHLFNHFHYKKCKFIYASSASVYGTNKNFLEVSANENPINFYSKSKLNIDNYIRNKTNNFINNKCNLYALRYFNVYGPGEEFKGRMASVVFQFYHQVLKEKEIRLFKGTDGYKDGEQLRDFIYIDDIIKVNIWFSENLPKSGIYNIGTGKAETFNKIAILIKEWFKNKSINCKIKYIDFPSDLIKSYQNYTCANITNLRKIDYNEKFISLGTGINRYLSFLHK